jgi:putative ABC transport system permease protein
MAWRDSRTSRRKLLLFSSSIVLGIAALVAIGSFGANLESAIQDQSKALLGADLVVETRIEPDAERLEFLNSLPGESSLETSFASMIYFPGTGGTRLVQIRAIEGGFPFYGGLETDPAGADREFRRSGGALVDEALLLQFDVKVGEEIRIGKLVTHVAGKLLQVPGESLAFSTIAPRVYIRRADLDATGLLGDASLARYRSFQRLPAGVDAEELVAELRPELDRLQFGVDTVEERQRDLGRAMENLYNFLNLVGFVALLLGGVGVASAIHVHVKSRLPSVAVLRCLGCTSAQTFAVFLAQGLALGVVGATAGAGLGMFVQWILPDVIGGFIPIEIEFGFAWTSIGMGAGRRFRSGHHRRPDVHRPGRPTDARFLPGDAGSPAGALPVGRGLSRLTVRSRSGRTGPSAPRGRWRGRCGGPCRSSGLAAPPDVRRPDRASPSCAGSG